jgi:hypothetical protein
MNMFILFIFFLKRAGPASSGALVALDQAHRFRQF